jgi:NAD(P)-dependent dehydrogenase (short-subunit alcohol dehydrogenase family)
MIGAPGASRVALVTGASGGIGPWIALGLARAGLHVVLAGRDRARTEAARSWVAGQVAGAAPELEIADLSSLAEARALGERVAARHGALAVLVNNAGVFRHRRALTAEGRETVLAVNHLAPFVLTRALLPALSAAVSEAGGARVVNVGSSASDHAGIDPDDLEMARRWDLVRAYARSKLALMMATFEWAERAPGVGFLVVHPGGVQTGLVRAGGLVQFGWWAMSPFLLTPEQGAATPLHAALTQDMAGVSGRYLKDSRTARPNRRALDAALRRRVWEATERLAGQDLRR